MFPQELAQKIKGYQEQIASLNSKCKMLTMKAKHATMLLTVTEVEGLSEGMEELDSDLLPAHPAHPSVVMVRKELVSVLFFLAIYFYIIATLLCRKLSQFTSVFCFWNGRAVENFCFLFLYFALYGSWRLVEVPAAVVCNNMQIYYFFFAVSMWEQTLKNYWVAGKR